MSRGLLALLDPSSQLRQGLILKAGWSLAPVIGSFLLRRFGDSGAVPTGTTVLGAS